MLEISFDARIEPAVQWSRAGHARVLDGGAVVAEVAWTTVVLP